MKCIYLKAHKSPLYYYVGQKGGYTINECYILGPIAFKQFLSQIIKPIERYVTGQLSRSSLPR